MEHNLMSLVCSLHSEIFIEDHDLLRLDRFRKGNGVACFIEHPAASSYKPNICLKRESIFTEAYLQKSRPFIVGILYGSPHKIDIFIYIDQKNF